jgi:hypothetical protein
MELNDLKKIVSQFKNNVFYNVFQMNFFFKSMQNFVLIFSSPTQLEWEKMNDEWVEEVMWDKILYFSKYYVWLITWKHFNITLVPWFISFYFIFYMICAKCFCAYCMLCFLLNYIYITNHLCYL